MSRKQKNGWEEWKFLSGNVQVTVCALDDADLSQIFSFIIYISKNVSYSERIDFLYEIAHYVALLRNLYCVDIVNVKVLN